MVDLLTSQPPDTQSAHEINRRVRQIKRDLAILGAIPFPEATQNGAPVVQVKELVPAIQDPRLKDGSLGRLPPGGSKATLPGFGRLLSNCLCRIAVHSGKWRYSAEGKCSQSRECGRCGALQDRTKHFRQWRYVVDRSCGQVRICIRCHCHDEHRVSHEWSRSWQVDRRWWQGAKLAHRCIRCETVEEWDDSD